MAQNDWLALITLNPNKDMMHFKEAGVDANNTVLKSAEEYKQMPLVLLLFSTPDGKFDDTAFNSYYTGALLTYNKFVKDDFKEALYNDYIHSAMDSSPYADDKKETPAFLILKVANPTKKTIGVLGIFEVGADNMSMREMGLTLKVWDYESGKWLDWTPNDDDKRGIFGFWNTPILVEAAWDEDGEHEENGRMIHHYTGLLKLNSDGMPYYETLGKRDVVNKNVLKYSDTFTVDGSKANKWDPFDSDGIDKSIGATSVDLVANVVPFFIPYVGTMYKWLTISKDLTKALAVFGKAGTDLFYLSEKPRGWDIFNNVSALTYRLDASQSDYSLSNLMSYENISNIIKDSVKLLYQLREISLIGKYLGLDPRVRSSKSLIKSHGDNYMAKYGKSMKLAIKDGDVDPDFFGKALAAQGGAAALSHKIMKFNETSRGLGSLYMAAVLSADVYGTMKLAGFSSEATALGLVGSFIGFKKLMDSSLGDVAVEGLGFDNARLIAKKFALELGEKLSSSAGLNLANRGTKIAVINNIVNKILGLSGKIASNVYTKNMAKEGLEEISEEVFLDSLLGLMSAVDWVFTNNLNANYNPFENNMMERYLAAGLGGVIGGGVFEGTNKLLMKIDNIKTGNYHKIADLLPKSTFNDIVTVILNGGTEGLINNLQKITKKGSIASTALSMEVDLNATNDKEVVFKAAESKEDSLNNVIGNYLIGFVKSLDTIINGGDYALTDSDIISRALIKDTRVLELIKNSSVATDILNDFNSVFSSLVKSQLQLKGVVDSDKDTLNRITLDISNKKLQLDDLLNSSKSSDYVERILFDLNRSISGGFYNSDIFIYAYSKGKPYNSLTDTEKETLKSEFDKFKNDNPQYRMYMFRSYQLLKKSLQPFLSKLSSQTGRESILLAGKFRNKLQEATSSITGEVSLEELDKALEDTKTEILTNIPRLELEKTLNPLGNVDFNFDETFDAFAKENPIYKLKIADLKTNSFSERLASSSDFTRVGLNLEAMGILNPDLLIQANNVNTVLDALLGILDNLVDKHTREFLTTVRDMYDNIDSFRALSEATANTIFGKLGTKSLDLEFAKLVLLDGDMNLDIMASLDKFSISIDDNGNYTLNIEANPEELEIAGENMIINIGPNSISVPDSDSFIQTGKTSIPITSLLATTLLRAEMSKDPVSQWSKLDPKSLVYKYLSDNFLDTRMNIILRVNSLGINLSSSVVLEALDEISKLISGDSIINVISLEENLYKSLSNLDDYVISNSITESLLRALGISTGILRSILYSSTNMFELSTFDLATILNTSRKSLGLDEYTLLDMSNVLDLSSEIADIEIKAMLLLNISELNAGDKVLNSKKTGVRLNSCLIGFMIEGPYGSKSPLLFTNELGDLENFFNFSDSISSEEKEKVVTMLELGSLSNEDYKLSFSILSRLHKALYDRFHELSESQQEEIITKMSGDSYFNRAFGETDIKKNSTENDFSGEFLADYFYMHMIADTSLFYGNMKNLISLEAIQYAPFASQLLDVESNWIFYNHIKEINHWLDMRKKNSSREVVKNVYATRHNTIFNLGDPGSGKTTAVAKITDTILRFESKDPISAWFAGPLKSTALKLGLLLGDTDGTRSFSRDELFSKLLTESGKAKYDTLIKAELSLPLTSTLEESNRLLSDLLNEFNTNDFTTTLPDIIYIDEITHFTGSLIDLISLASKLTGDTIRIIGLGDNNQMRILDNNKLDVVSSVFLITLLTPNLNMSVRSNNTTKLDNLFRISSLVKLLSLKDNEAKRSGVRFDTSPYIKMLNNDIVFKYYEDDTTIHGEKVVTTVSDSDITKMMNNLLKGEVLALITDRLDSDLAKKFSTLDSTKVVIRPYDEVLGAEYKYAIVDVGWRPFSNLMDVSTLKDELRKAYTLMSRSSVGTVIVDLNRNSIFRNVERTPISRDVTLSLENIKEYSKFVLDALPGDVTINDIPKTETIIEAPAVGIDEVTPTSTLSAIQKLTEAVSISDTEDIYLSNIISYPEFHIDGGTNEDLLGSTSVLDRQALTNLRSILLNSNISDVLKNNSNHKIILIKSEIYRAFLLDTNLDSISTFNDALVNGEYYIKVKIAELGDIAYNVPATDSTPKVGDIISKLVYRVNINDTYRDISLGLLGDNINIDSILEAKKNITTPIYFKVSPSFRKKRLEIRPHLDIRGLILNKELSMTSIDWLKDLSISKLRLLHPELIISDPLVTAEDVKRFNLLNLGKSNLLIRSGELIVLVSKDLTRTLDELIDIFRLYILNPSSVDIGDIVPIVVTPIGLTPSTFFSKWREVFHKNVNGTIAKGNPQYLGGYMMGARFRNILWELGTYISDLRGYLDRYKKNPTKATSPKSLLLVLDNLAKLNITPINIVDSLTSLLFSKEKTALGLGKLDLSIDFNKLAPSLLGMTDSDLAKIESVLASELNNALGLLKALELLKTGNPDDKFTILYNTLSEVLEGEGISGTQELMMEFFKLGLLPPIAYGGSIITRISNAYHSDPTFRSIVDILVPNTRLFKYGIMISPINSVNALVKGGGLFSSGLSSDELYLNNYIGEGRIYIPNTMVDSKPISSFSQETVKPIIGEKIEKLPISVEVNLDSFDSELTTKIMEISGDDIIYRDILLPLVGQITGDTREKRIDSANLILLKSVVGLALISYNGELLGIVPSIDIEDIEGSMNINIDNVNRNNPNKYLIAIKKLALDLPFTLDKSNLSKLHFINSMTAIGIVDGSETIFTLNAKATNTELSMKLSPNTGLYSDIFELLMKDPNRNIKTNC